MSDINSTAILQIVPVVFVLVALTIGFVRNQSARQQQAQGILWLQAMRMLITHIQRHRGLSAGVLSGDGSLRKSMDEVQLQVSRDFEQISAVGDWIKQHLGWQSITQHWARLAGNVNRLPAERSIEQHNKLIKNILVLVDEIAEQHYLGSHSGFRSSGWRDLLMLVELIGQSRALGTVIATHPDGGYVKEIISARTTLQKATQSILELLESPDCRASLNQHVLQEVINLLAYIDTALFSESPIPTPKTYYDRLTETIDFLYDKFDEELSSVNRRLVRVQ